MDEEHPVSQRMTQIFAAAYELFAQDGYHDTTMGAIAEKAGLAKGTLYWYFKGKRELFIALFRHVMQEMVCSWRASTAEPTLSPAAQLRASMTFFRRQARQVTTVFEIMLQARTTNWRDEEMAHAIAEIMQVASQVLEENIARGVASGDFRPIPPEQASFVLMSLVAGLVMRMGSGRWHEDWSELIDSAESLITHGLLASPLRGGE